jgi:hypothetical protein
LLESHLRSCSSTQAPQASEGDVLEGIDELDRCLKARHYFIADAVPNIDMHIELRMKGISQCNYYQLELLNYQELAFRRCPALISLIVAICN